MKRLLKISLDTALLSLIPVISWFVLGIIIDENLINVFTLTYPIQFIWYMFKSIFSTGANISKEKDKNDNATMSGLVLGTIIGFFVFGFFVLNIDKYIQFMNMDILTYREFAIYSIIQLYIQLIFTFIINKLYFEEKNDLANKYSITFNILNFFALLLSCLMLENKMAIVIVTLITIFIYTIIIAAKTLNRFKLEFQILNFIKYDSVELFNSMAFFIIFLFGLSNVIKFGEEYILALTFVALITDTQWDAFDSISTVAKIDISKNRFNYKEHIRNAYKLLIIVLITVFFMFILLYHFYELNLWITLIYLAFEIVNYLLYPIYRIKTCYLQLEYSATKITLNKIFASILRTCFSFITNPFCTGIGQVFSSIYQTVSLSIIFDKAFIVNKEGIIEKIEENDNILEESLITLEIEEEINEEKYK